MTKEFVPETTLKICPACGVELVCREELLGTYTDGSDDGHYEYIFPTHGRIPDIEICVMSWEPIEPVPANVRLAK